MQHKGFFRRAGPFPLRDLVARTGVTHPDGADLDIGISDIRPLDAAGPADASFFENPKYAAQLAATSAAACFVAAKAASRTPAGCAALISPHPYRSFAEALFLFYPEAGQPLVAPGEASDYVGGVHRTAQVEDGAQIECGAIVGAEAEIGSGTRVAAGAVVGYRVHVGRDSYIGPNVSLTHALVGDRVTIHAGVSIGQDGFGFAMSGSGHFKVPQIGRVIVQDDVEIGANTTIDRGALRDTIIGEGTKIDNLVQIGHNVVVGRHCVIVAQTGVSGSSELSDHVVLGGQVGVIGHVRIGAGAQIAATSNVNSDVPPGARWGGTPAKPVRQWFREMALLRRLAEKETRADGDRSEGEREGRGSEA
jgi:UDP-3-O-[3-hydroxymyristoyl] glucosamine N-acyltransferase